MPGEEGLTEQLSFLKISPKSLCPLGGPDLIEARLFLFVTPDRIVRELLRIDHYCLWDQDRAFRSTMAKRNSLV